MVGTPSSPRIARLGQWPMAVGALSLLEAAAGRLPRRLAGAGGEADGEAKEEASAEVRAEVFDRAPVEGKD